MMQVTPEIGARIDVEFVRPNCRRDDGARDGLAPEREVGEQLHDARRHGEPPRNAVKCYARRSKEPDCKARHPPQFGEREEPTPAPSAFRRSHVGAPRRVLGGKISRSSESSLQTGKACNVRNVSKIICILVAVALASPGTGGRSETYTAAEKAAIAAKHTQARRDFRTFFGLDAPHYDAAEQVTRRLDMCDALRAEILDAYASKKLTTNDPTAGLGGAAQHAVAAMNPGSDLGKLLRDRGPPKDLAADGNYYAKLTRAEPTEALLRQAIVASPGNLQPADVMRMALRASGGNYVLATLTAHNLLKNVAYIGRADANLAASTAKELFDVRGDKVVAVASKLVSLRGDPSGGDLLGPWYHIFGVLFIGSITSRVQSQSMTAAEEFSRYLINEKLGIKSYSGIDREKADWDRCAANTMAAIHPILYDGERVASTANPTPTMYCRSILGRWPSWYATFKDGPGSLWIHQEKDQVLGDGNFSFGYGALHGAGDNYAFSGEWKGDFGEFTYTPNRAHGTFSLSTSYDMVKRLEKLEGTFSFGAFDNPAMMKEPAFSKALAGRPTTLSGPFAERSCGS
jgi:hypothetical protein